MAITTVADIGNATSTTNAATIALTPAAQVNIGDKLIIWLTFRLNGVGLTGVADNSSQSGAANVYTIAKHDASSASSISASIVSCNVTRNILTSNAITVTWDTASNGQKQIAARTFAAVATSAAVAAGTSGTSTLADSGTAGTPSLADSLVVGCANRTTGTPTVGTDGQGNTMTLHKSGASYIAEYRIETAAAAYKATAVTTSGDWECVCAIFVGLSAVTKAEVTYSRGHPARNPLLRRMERLRSGIYVPDFKPWTPQPVVI